MTIWRRRFKKARDVKQGRLARARWADKRNGLTRPKDGIDAAQNDDFLFALAEGARDALKLEDRSNRSGIHGPYS